MKPQDVIRDLIASSLPKFAIAIFIIGIRIFGELTDDEVTNFLSQLGYTYTKFSGIDSVIVSDGSKSYTLVQLITKYHDEFFSTTILAPGAVIDTVKEAFNEGYLTQIEETTLEGLYANG